MLKASFTSKMKNVGFVGLFVKLVDLCGPFIQTVITDIEGVISTDWKRAVGIDLH